MNTGGDRQNVALVGLGMVAETHVQAIADLKDIIHLRGIHARNQDSMNAFGAVVESHCGYYPETYDSVESLAADSNLDFVIVATPPNARRDICKALAAAGISILMEKPIERTSKAATDIVDLCEQADVTLGIVFQHRVREASVELRQRMESGEFGTLHLVEVAVPWWRDQSYYDEPGRGTYARDGGGVLISQAIHTLDLMLSLTGPVAEVQAMARTSAFHRMESEDFVTAGLSFQSGAIGSLVASTASFPGGAESIIFHFDKAVITLKSGCLDIAWRDGRDESTGADAATGGGADPMAFTHAWHRDIIQDFSEALKDSRDPICTGREALNVHYLIDALVKSSAEKSAVKVSRNGN